MFGSLLLFIAVAIVKLVQGDDINVNVGEGGLYIVHPSFDASIGDVLVFSFGDGPSSTNYSVVQGTYDKPCFALEGGFYSGFLPVSANEQASQFVFRVTVNTTDPIYYYCGQTGDCQAGMVATVNAPYDAPGSFVDYQSAARLVTSVGPLPTAVMGGEIVQVYTYSTTTTSSMSSSSTTLSQSNTTSSTTSNSSPTTGSSQMTSTSGSSSSAPTTTSSSTTESSSTAESSGSSSTESTASSITSKLPSNGTSTSTSTSTSASTSASTSTPQPVLNQGISVYAWNTQVLLFALLAFAAIML